MIVVVTSDHSLIGNSLVSMLHGLADEEPIEATIADSASVIVCARKCKADVILIEATTDFSAGISTVRRIREAMPESRVVVLGTDSDEVYIFEAVNAGAQGYLARDASGHALVATLRGVSRGEFGLTRTATLRVVQQLCQALRATQAFLPADAHCNLTRREQEVFDLVRRGLRSREIAEHLGIAEATVYKHIQNVLDKLQVHSRTQAVFLTHSRNNAPPTSADYGKQHVQTLTERLLRTSAVPHFPGATHETRPHS